MRSLGLLFGLILIIGTAACGDDDGTSGTDSGTGGTDSGTGGTDSGTGDTDSGTTGADSGTTDTDSGTTDVDSGTTEVDSGTTASAEAVTFCEQYDATCGFDASADNRFDSMDACTAAYDAAAMTCTMCIETHLMLADGASGGMRAQHCTHATMMNAGGAGCETQCM